MKRKTVNIKNITKENFEKYLNKIGWSLRDHGCDHLMLYDCLGNMTKLCLLFGHRIEEEAWNESGLFGSTSTAGFHNGSLAFYFESCDMQYSVGWGYPSLSLFPKGLPKKDRNVWLSFYDTREIV